MGLRRLAKRIAADHQLRMETRLKGLKIEGERVVAGMATMPSRKATFTTSFRSIIRQVDRLYLYLDGHEKVPAIARNDARVVPIFAHEYPGLHANGKLLGLALEKEPCLYACLDDDIYFPRNYIFELGRALARLGDDKIVGLHGTVLARPLEGYYTNRTSVGQYAREWKEDTKVDLLGSGAVLFRSAAINVDVRDWPKVSMTDIGLAIAAAQANIQMISISRDTNLVLNLASQQADSLFVARKKDDSLQTKLGRELIEILDG